MKKTAAKPTPKTSKATAHPAEAKDARLDDWGSLLMGMGTEGGSKVTTYKYSASPLQFNNERTVESAYQQDDMVARVIDQIPDEAVAKLFTFEGSDTESEDTLDVVTEVDTSGALDSLVTSWKFARAYGGGATWILVEDGRTQDQPMDMANIRRVVGFREFTAYELTPRTFYQDVMRFGEPELFTISRSDGGTSEESGLGMTIHESRLIQFRGIAPSRANRTQIGKEWWGISMLERVYSAVQTWQLGYSATAHILSDGAQAVFTVDGLKALLAAGRSDLILKRMQTIQLSRSVARSIMIDKNDEFRREAYNMQGIKDVLDKLDQRVASSLGYAVTILMGSSPGGLNATGASDYQGYYRLVSRVRKRDFVRPLNRMVEIFLADQSRNFGNITNWKISYPAMYEMSDMENATYRKTVAETDKIYIDSGVVLAEEVAKSRFQKDGWSAETTIDLELREEPVPDTSSKDPNDDPSSVPPDAMPSEVDVDTEELAGETPPPTGSADMSPDAEEVDAAKKKK